MARAKTFNGVTLGPNSPAATLKVRRGEEYEQLDCDRAVLILGGTVVSLSQSRASMVTEGLPDRRYRVDGMAFWWEVKAADGKLTKDQFDFLMAENECFAPAGCGTLDDLNGFLVEARRSSVIFLSDFGSKLVKRWAEKGFRSVPKKRRKRRYA